MRTLLMGCAIAAAVLLSACQEEDALNRANASADQGFGAAVRHDIQAQTVDPNAGYKYTAPMTAEGERAALAQGRYVTGTTIPPAETGMSEIGGVGGGGGGGGTSASSGGGK